MDPVSGSEAPGAAGTEEASGVGPGGLAAGTVALVTGAGRGIGAATARTLSERGLRVVLTARSAEQLDAVAAACPGETLSVTADITDPGAAETIFAAAEDHFGSVGVLIANAGTGFSARVERTGDADWNRMLELNLTAPFRCIRRAVPAMRAARWGRIVAIASSAARIGEPYIAAYTASKHGVLGLIRSVAAEVAGEGITANAVCPGYVDTAMTAATVETITKVSGRTADAVRETLAGKQPNGRLVSPQEVAEAVWFCLNSPALNGQGITIDGGAVQV